MYGREGKISTFDLPNLNWLEPVVRFMTAIEAIVRFRLRYYMILEKFGMNLEILLFESRADLFTRKKCMKIMYIDIKKY